MKTTFNYRIEQDTNAENPRTSFDNVGTMVCWHRNYNLGDEQPKESIEDFLFNLAAYNTYDKNGNLAETPPIAQMLKRIEKDHVILPLFLYNHSGITISTSPFGCRWDSGQVGFIYVHRDKALKEWGLKPNNWRKKAATYLTGEVNTYDQYLRGDVYGYVVFEENKKGKIVEDHIDSCWGFYDEEYCEKEAKSMAEHLTKERIEEKKNRKEQKRLCAAIMHL